MSCTTMLLACQLATMCTGHQLYVSLMVASHAAALTLCTFWWFLQHQQCMKTLLAAVFLRHGKQSG